MQLLAGVHLDQVRTSPELQKAFAQWWPLLDRAGEAADLLLGYNGTDLLWAARGQFPAAPAGARLLSPQVAIAGSEAAVRAAAAQHATGKTGAPALVGQAEPIAAQPIWVAVSGGAQLPLSGNAANASRLLAMTEFTTIAIEANSGLALHAAGVCASADQARQLEETLRGMVTLARATAHDGALVSVLGSVEIRRDNRTVHVDLRPSAETIQGLLGAGAK